MDVWAINLVLLSHRVSTCLFLVLTRPIAQIRLIKDSLSLSDGPITVLYSAGWDGAPIAAGHSGQSRHEGRIDNYGGHRREKTKITSVTCKVLQTHLSLYA